MPDRQEGNQFTKVQNSFEIMHLSPHLPKYKGIDYFESTVNDGHQNSNSLPISKTSICQITKWETSLH